VRHRRILLLAPGRWLLVHDEVTADRPRSVTAWFHLPPDAALRPSVVDLTGEAAVTTVRGQSLPRLEGWVVGGYGQLVESDAISLTREGTSVTFDTLFLLGGEAAAAAAGGLCWTDGTTTHGARVTVTGDLLELAPCPEASATP
jgi:hypothetical protein